MVIFGAGKIGRSFIGQLFSRGGYEVVFADVDLKVIDALNRERQYKVVIKSEKGDQTLIIKNARGISALQSDLVIEELSTADIAAVSVGKMALSKVIPVLAEGLLQREKITSGKALDLIIAENMRDAASFIEGQLKKFLPAKYPLSQRLGLVETSIGKMVPVMPAELQEKDPLLVFAEPYNQLILDKDAFINPIPHIEGLEPRSPMKAWVDRKSFIHNFGHAALAYYGNLYHPQCRYLYELLAHPDAYDFTAKCMQSAARVLLKMYHDVFSPEDLDKHITDLIQRFANKALG
jgi:mannitol-1-phosphate 5-dehydrogenase